MTNEQTLGKTKEKECIKLLPSAALFPNPSQPRFIFEDEPILRLADSIRRHGILQPITVRRADRDSYQIIAGERRWRAAQVAGLKEIPCIVLDIGKQQSAEFALIENIQREDLNPFEQAAAIAALIDLYGLTQEQAARQLSSSQSYIANKLRILKLSPPERAEIIKHKLSERHARSFLRVSDPDLRIEVIRYTAEHQLNVSDTDKYIDRALANKKNTPRAPQKKGYMKDLRAFFNTLDRTVETLKTCGYSAVTSIDEGDNETVYTVRIPHNKTFK